MKDPKHLFIFIVLIAACIVMSFFSPFSSETVSQFQKKSVAAPYLNSGETGKILKMLNVLYPIERQSTHTEYNQNVEDVLERAVNDRNQWLQMDKYSGYKETGVFCYFELETNAPKIPFVAQAKIEGEWQEQASLFINKTRRVYPFFIDATGNEIPFQLIVFSKTDLLKIRSMVFIQNGYHPLIFTDPVSLHRFTSNTDNENFTINASGLVIQPSKNPHLFRHLLKFKKLWMVGVSKFQEKQGQSNIDLIAGSFHPLLKNLSITDEQLSHISKNSVPVLAIEADEDDLYSDKNGILKNHEGHGKSWERISYIRFARDGENVFKEFSGLRLQGGAPARQQGFLNFRILFRGEYGRARLGGSTLFDGAAGDIKRLAVIKSYWDKWPANDPIAYDISRHIGVLAPPTELIKLYLNGKDLGLYYLLPHLGETQITSLLPGDDYKYYRYRSNQHSSNEYFFAADLSLKINTINPISESYAQQYFDLDNLTSQLFSYLYNGTTDYCQGIALKEKSPDSKMIWFSWDVDQSFIDFDLEIKKWVDERESWEQHPHLDEFIGQESENERHYCPRVHLFRRLVNEDPAFRQKVKHKFAEIMNHLTTDEYINKLLYDYWDQLGMAQYPHRDEYISNLSDYFQGRKPFIFKQIETYFPSPPAQKCSVSANRYPVIVDGYLKNKPYEGNYFPGAILKVTTAQNTIPKTWQVNDEFVEAQEISLKVGESENCSIHVDF